jgi:poly(A) polymerase
MEQLNAAEWRRRPGVAAVLDALGAEEGLTRYVGGAVRDDLLGLPVNDIDLATKLRPDAVIERLNNAQLKAVPTGIEHGTVTAVSNGQPFEVTSLRRDVSTDGRRAIIEYTDDWREDAARRDFTLNALMADPQSGKIFDYFGGLEDLADRRVRFIGNPLQRIAEDHLRILRFFRFHARFGHGEPDGPALNACTERANDLMALSRERIADEVLKLLAVEDPVATVQLMVDHAILKPVLPEIQMTGLQQLEQLTAAEKRAGIDGDPLRRLAALLPKDPDLAERVAVRLKLSKVARKRLACAAGRKLGDNPRALAYRVGLDCAVDRLLLTRKSEEAASILNWIIPRLPIGGGALIERGIPQGAEVARTLRAIEDRWVEAGFPSGEPFERLLQEIIGRRQ